MFHCFPITDPSVAVVVEHREEKVVYTCNSNNGGFEPKDYWNKC